MQHVYLRYTILSFDFVYVNNTDTVSILKRLLLVTVDFWYSRHSTKPLILVHCQWNNFDQVSQRGKPIFPPPSFLAPSVC